ncbi:hypothetical protein KOM00_13085 [Geomonas sp. Red69]|uniref:Uncharacterized protein n=1 Tax=Geomonas diazotrophica TaxID=2843197 RepID=A0ABX8JG65_9BACT|nr:MULTISPECIES: hypothetical protein [Geomonas]MBU5637663.1 hypothetical protein [Geomonas diazotrophica]QWV96202.1 hypothetical protein KP005_12510 [Geomonas nitrogeniifigens]QXE85269.1 hypothetical protein KP003_12790 [Geomonas nitrogeniifigens]
MEETTPVPMTAESVGEILREAGAQVMVRSGRSENYSAPREFSFEVKAIFENGMGLHVVARQFNYRDPWEAEGRINELVDVMLLRDGALTPLPKGYPYFQGIDEECGLDETMLREVIDCVRKVNPKLYLLQEMTGDL